MRDTAAPEMYQFLGRALRGFFLFRRGCPDANTRSDSGEKIDYRGQKHRRVGQKRHRKVGKGRERILVTIRERR